MTTDGATVLHEPGSPTSAYDRSAPAAKFSLSFGSKKPISKPQSVKRPHAALEEEDDEDVSKVQQEITTFGHDGEPAKKKIDRVIKSIPNADWQDPLRRRKQKSGLPGNQHAKNRAEEEVPDKINVEEPKFGLNVVERTNGATFEAAGMTPPTEDDEDRNRAEPKAKTADDEALDALTGSTRPAPKTITPPSEDEAFRDSYDEAPAAPTAADFAATPVEGFGAAILRGYLSGGKTLEDLGYSEDGKEAETKRRPGLLGLGAKESGLGVELGAWGKGAKAQKGEGYVPLGRKNRKTGEMVTDEELKQKMEQQKIDEKNRVYVSGDSDRKERHRDGRDRDRDRKQIEYREKDDEDSDRRRDRRRDCENEDDRPDEHRRWDRDHDRRRHGKDRAYEEDDRDRRRHRDRYRDYEDDRDRHRRKAREVDGHRSYRR